MRFYKVHAAKFKNDKVIFLADQFNEIGPDAFAQTEFEYIMLSDKVTIIRDHAFSNVRDCSIYIPASVETIDPLAFESMGSFNLIYCVKGSYAYNRCRELGITVDTDVAACISGAKKAKEKDDDNKKIIADRMAEQLEAERIKKAAQEEADRIRRAAEEEAKKAEEARKAEEAKRVEEERRAAIAKAAQEAPKPASQPVKKPTPSYSRPIFVDEEHRSDNRPAPVTRPSVPVRPVVAPKPVTPPSSHTAIQKPSAQRGMSRLDDYDDELKKMAQKQKKKGSWFWGDDMD